jgi:hypothetical protein
MLQGQQEQQQVVGLQQPVPVFELPVLQHQVWQQE